MHVHACLQMQGRVVSLKWLWVGGGHGCGGPWLYAKAVAVLAAAIRERDGQVNAAGGWEGHLQGTCTQLPACVCVRARAHMPALYRQPAAAKQPQRRCQGLHEQVSGASGRRPGPRWPQAARGVAATCMLQGLAGCASGLAAGGEMPVGQLGLGGDHPCRLGVLQAGGCMGLQGPWPTWPEPQLTPSPMQGPGAPEGRTPSVVGHAAPPMDYVGSGERRRAED
jgi:hypothetical protein